MTIFQMRQPRHRDVSLPTVTQVVSGKGRTHSSRIHALVQHDEASEM